MARLVAAAVDRGVMRVLPFWADGGSGAGDDRFVPRGHVLAAHPSRVVTARLEDLGPGGLVPFLRTHLPPSSSSSLPLVTVLLGYDAGRAGPGSEPLYPGPERTPGHPHDALPHVLIATYEGYLEAPSERGPWRAIGDVANLVATLAAYGALDLAPPELADLRDSSPPERYLASFADIAEGISAGDFYQVNLARRLEAAWRPSAGTAGGPSAPAIAAACLRLHGALRERQPVAFGALVPCAESAWLVSASPECLLRWRASERRAMSYPIKGTIGRGVGEAHDAELGAALRESAKERAEHVMIVDLVRNDLGRVAIPGGVTVPAMFAELELATVRHMVAEVAATIAPERDLADLVGAIFPGGSITGAPKIAAMKALDRLEGFARGYYCGSLGVVRGGREATFSILIRSAVVSEDGLTYGSGGGLVADSRVAHELEETRLKARALASAMRVIKRRHTS